LFGGTIAVSIAAAAAAGSLSAATTTPAGYTRAVIRICTGALLFDGRHQIGTRAGAISVSRDIRATGQRKLDDMYAATYLRIWYQIERAHTPQQRARLPLILNRVVHQPDNLKQQAHQLEVTLHVPDCTGGG
jgi:hypothetical protein